MQITYSQNGKKAIKFRHNEYNGFIALFVQFNKDAMGSVGESLIQMKTFKTEKARQKWADKMLAQG